MKIFNRKDWQVTILILASGVTLMGILNLPNINYNNNFVKITNAQSATSDKNSLTLSLPDLFSKVRNSVVQVSDVVLTPNGASSRLGSGFVFDKEGHIITNYHVVQSNSRKTQFDVTFSDGNSFAARLVGSDPYSDLAVLKLENVPSSQLVPLSITNSSQLRVGDTVIAIGNPFGLAGSMTTGIVSGLSRILPSSSNNENPLLNAAPLSFSIPNIIQTDAAINPGNSGGPLLNLKGEVIGINTAIFSNTGVYAGVGFAVPSNTLTKIVPTLIRTGTYQHPYLGVVGTNLSPTMARAIGLKETSGFLITGITPGGPADKAGLRAAQPSQTDTGMRTMAGGDVILKIDNNVVKKIDDILSYLESHSSIGDTVHLTIDRDGAIQNVDTVLDPRPSPEKLQNIAEQSNPDLGTQSNNGGHNSLFEQCKRVAGPDLCGYFFGR